MLKPEGLEVADAAGLAADAVRVGEVEAQADPGLVLGKAKDPVETKRLLRNGDLLLRNPNPNLKLRSSQQLKVHLLIKVGPKRIKAWLPKLSPREPATKVKVALYPPLKRRMRASIHPSMPASQQQDLLMFLRRTVMEVRHIT